MQTRRYRLKVGHARYFPYPLQWITPSISHARNRTRGRTNCSSNEHTSLLSASSSLYLPLWPKLTLNVFFFFAVDINEFGTTGDSCNTNEIKTAMKSFSVFNIKTLRDCENMLTSTFLLYSQNKFTRKTEVKIRPFRRVGTSADTCRKASNACHKNTIQHQEQLSLS